MAFGSAYAHHLRETQSDPLRTTPPRLRRRSATERIEDAAMGYGASAALVAAVTLVRMVAGDAFAAGYIGAIAVSVAAFGGGPGIVAAVLALVGLHVVFDAPLTATAIEALVVVGAGAALRHSRRTDRRPSRTSSEVRALVRQTRAASLRADVAVAVATATGRDAILRASTDAIVRHLGVAFAHVWLEGDRDLALAASSSSHVSLGRARAIGAAGSLAREVFTADDASLVVGLAREGDANEQTWFAREGLCAFAGQPVRRGGRAAGAIAVYSRAHLGEDELRALGAVAELVSAALGRFAERAEEHVSTNPSEDSIEAAAPVSGARIVAAA
jgi:hypothetical protein